MFCSRQCVKRPKARCIIYTCPGMDSWESAVNKSGDAHLVRPVPHQGLANSRPWCKSQSWRRKQAELCWSKISANMHSSRQRTLQNHHNIAALQIPCQSASISDNKNCTRTRERPCSRIRKIAAPAVATHIARLTARCAGTLLDLPATSSCHHRCSVFRSVHPHHGDNLNKKHASTDSLESCTQL